MAVLAIWSAVIFSFGRYQREIQMTMPRISRMVTTGSPAARLPSRMLSVTTLRQIFSYGRVHLCQREYTSGGRSPPPKNRHVLAHLYRRAGVDPDELAQTLGGILDFIYRALGGVDELLHAAFEQDAEEIFLGWHCAVQGRPRHRELVSGVGNGDRVVPAFDEQFGDGIGHRVTVDRKSRPTARTRADGRLILGQQPAPLLNPCEQR